MTAAVYSDAYYAAVLPRPALSPSGWADTHGRLISEGDDAGPWKTRPVQRAILDAFGHIRIETITCLKSARIGWTKILGHAIGYFVAQDPCSILVVQPTATDADDFSKEDVDPMIEFTPDLARQVSAKKVRSSRNTLNAKHYPGGILHLTGASAPRGFRRIGVRAALFDEVDGYPQTAGNEGDQIRLGIARTKDHDDRKIAIGSTPTVQGASKVDRYWEASSKGYCFLTCPHCGTEHVRKFRKPKRPILMRGEPVPVSFIQWDDDDPQTARWICPGCEEPIRHKHHRRMLKGCKWRGEAWSWDAEGGFTFEPGFRRHIGFSIWAGYGSTSNCAPDRLVEEFLDAHKNIDELKTFINTVLGEAWVEDSEATDERYLMTRRRKYEAECPADVLLLVAGVDVQADRIEMEIIGYGRAEETFGIDYVVLYGDPTGDEIWLDLADALRRTYRHASGVDLSISAAGVDSGYLPKRAYQFVEDFRSNYVYPVKGQAGAIPIVEQVRDRAERLKKRRKKGVTPERIGVDEAKTVIYRRLANVSEPGPGFSHFPDFYPDEYFLQLTAEVSVTIYKHGTPIRREWRKIRPRNEALDCRVYGYAAYLLAKFNLDAVADVLQARIAALREPRPAVVHDAGRRRDYVPGEGYDDPSEGRRGL